MYRIFSEEALMLIVTIFVISLLAGLFATAVCAPFVPLEELKHPFVGIVAFLAGFASIALFNTHLSLLIAFTCGLFWVAGWQIFLFGRTLAVRKR